jgi:hypothetical protein
MSPNRLRFQPPKPCQAIGTGMGTLMPTMPTWIRRANSRAMPPSLVKQATPLPYSWALTSSTPAAKSATRTHDSTGPEDLLLVDAHLRRDMVEQRAAGEEAALQAGTVRPRPSTTQRRAFLTPSSI